MIAEIWASVLDPSPRNGLLCNGADRAEIPNGDGVHLGLITIILVPDNCCYCGGKKAVSLPLLTDELFFLGADFRDEDRVHLGLITTILVPDNCWCCCCC